MLCDRCNQDFDKKSYGGHRSYCGKSHIARNVSLKGKTYEQIYGIEKAKEMRIKCANANPHATGMAKTPEKEAQRRIKISKSTQKAIAEGRHVTAKPGGITTSFRYVNWLGENCVLQGSYELQFAKFLDEQKIHWIKNQKGFKYTFQSKERTYFPDFFLKDWNVYVEVKGYETEKDHAKWHQFPHHLQIVRIKELKDLSKWISDLKVTYSNQTTFPPLQEKTCDLIFAGLV